MNAQSQNLPVLAPEFGTNGNMDYQISGLSFSGIAKCHALQTDGKLIIGGYSYDPINDFIITSLLRIDPICGNLDLNFGENGFVKRIFEKRTSCHDITLQQDGKIVGCGAIAQTTDEFHQHAGVFRLNSDGSVDSTFNGQGYIKFDLLNSVTCQAHKVFIDNQGKILVVVKGGSLNNMSMAIYKFKSNGEPDSTYGENGHVVIPNNQSPSSFSISAAMGSDSSITMVSQVGNFGSSVFIGVGKVDKHGVRDSTFNATGYRTYPELDITYGEGPKGYDIAFLSDGRFVAAIGKNVSGNNGANLVAFLPNGDIDNSFGTNGMFSFAGTDAVTGGIDIDEEDRILLFSCNNSSLGPGAVLRILPNGTLDSDFGDNGLILAPYNAQPWDYRIFTDGLILPNGDIVAYGYRGEVGYAASRLSFNPSQDGSPQIFQNGNELTTSGFVNIQWFLNGEEIPGATTSTIDISELGTYTVSTGFDNCTFTSDPFDVFALGVQEVNTTTLKIRNNPTQDFIFIDNAAANIPWEVYNIEGRRVMSGRNNMNGKIDLRSITPGIYIVRFMNDFGVVNFKVVKQ